MTSTTDLSAYAGLAAQVAALGKDGEIEITPDHFETELPEHLNFGQAALIPSHAHVYASDLAPDAPFEIVDVSPGFDWFAEDAAFRLVGAWFLHVLFSGRDWAGLCLTHPSSRIKSFYVAIRRPWVDDTFLRSERSTTYTSYLHMPEEVHRHAFAGPSMTPVERVRDDADRPMFRFGWSDNPGKGTQPAEAADQIILEITPEGLAAMAGLFFDMPHPELGRVEVNMEMPLLGFEGTRPLSLQARFWRPGSDYFYCDRLDDLRL